MIEMMQRRRTRNAHAIPVQREYVVPGAAMVSLWGCTRRTVAFVEGDDVFLRSAGGTIDRIPMDAVLRNWGRPPRPSAEK